MKGISGKEMLRLLQRKGWNLRRVNGSHHILTKHGRTEAISVPVHANQTMGSGLQKHIMKMAGLTDADL